MKNAVVILAGLLMCNVCVAQQWESIQIMNAADRKRIEAHLPRVEPGAIRDALKAPHGIWYDRESMPPLVQAGPGNNAQNEFSQTGKLGVMSGLALQTLRSLDDQLAAAPGGTAHSPNVSSVKRFVLPLRPNGKLYPFVFYTDELEGFTNPNATVTGFDETWPIGTVAIELITVNDLVNKQQYVAIIRARIRMRDYWAMQSFCPIRTADECRQAIQIIRPNWKADARLVAFMRHLDTGRMVTTTRRDKTPGNPRFGTKPGDVFAMTANVDTLPPLPADVVGDILTKFEFKETTGYQWKVGCQAPTTEQPFHIVPQFYDGPFISVDDSCVRCHESVQISARRHDPNNGKVAWMSGSKEGFISAHHVEPSTLSNTPNPEVRPRKQWLDTGVIALHDGDPVRFPKSVYHRIVVQTQGRFR